MMTSSVSKSELIGFNQLNRDRWVTKIAQSLPVDTRILDIGAGPCRYRQLFTNCDYKAQDFNQYNGTQAGLLKDNWVYGSIDYVCDATQIPVEDESFDAVLCTEVLEHVPEPIKVLNEIGRIVKPGGRAFLSAPLGSGLHQQPYHYYGGFTPHFYLRFLDEVGLDVVSIEHNGSFFRLFLQELNRGVGIIRANRSYHRWHPGYWFLQGVSSKMVARWLTQLDDQIPVDEFTVGYHIEAIKRVQQP